MTQNPFCSHSLARCTPGTSLCRRMTVLGCTRTVVVSCWELLPWHPNGMLSQKDPAVERDLLSVAQSTIG